MSKLKNILLVHVPTGLTIGVVLGFSLVVGLSPRIACPTFPRPCEAVLSGRYGRPMWITRDEVLSGISSEIRANDSIEYLDIERNEVSLHRTQILRAAYYFVERYWLSEPPVMHPDGRVVDAPAMRDYCKNVERQKNP